MPLSKTIKHMPALTKIINEEETNPTTRITISSSIIDSKGLDKEE